MHRGQQQAMMISRVPSSALSDLHPAVRVAGPARPLIGVEERGTAGVSRVPPSALSDLHPGLRLAGPARPLIGVEERGTAGAAARGRRPAPHQAPAPPGLGRPRHPGRADPAPAQKAAGAPAGHARHRAPVAPPPGQKEVDLPRTGRAGRRSAPRSPRSSSGSPPRTPHGDTSGSRANCSSSVTGPARPRSAGSSRRCGSRRLPSGVPIRPGGSSCTPKPRPCWPPTSFTWTAR